MSELFHVGKLLAFIQMRWQALQEAPHDLRDRFSRPLHIDSDCQPKKIGIKGIPIIRL